MALKRNERYPGRFGNPNAAHPQGAFKNRTSPTSQDGSYLESDWVNDWDGFFARLLTVAGTTPNGNVDTGTSSQYYDSLITVVKSLSPINKASYGWQKLPSGLIIQWGNTAPVSGTATISFPIAFPQNPYFIGTCCRQATFPTAMQSIIVNDATLTPTGCTTRNLQYDGTSFSAAESAFFWFAIG